MWAEASDRAKDRRNNQDSETNCRRVWKGLETKSKLRCKRAAAPHRRRRTCSIVAHIDDPPPSNTKLSVNYPAPFQYSACGSLRANKKGGCGHDPTFQGFVVNTNRFCMIKRRDRCFSGLVQYSN